MSIQCSSLDDLTRRVEKKIASVVDSVKKASGKSIAVGISSDATYPNGKKVSTVARYVEYGVAGRFGPRPFMRTATVRNRKKWTNEIGEKCILAIRGNDSGYANGLSLVGEDIVEDIRSQITDMGAVDTGTLRNSIEARVIE